MRILKVASCPTISGKATLTYHIGCTTDNEIQFRVVVNTGGGLFSPEWISLSAIQPAFEQAPLPLTSFPLIKLYQGKSTNTPAFLMAVLKNEGLIRNLEGKIRGYEIFDSTPFMAEVNSLIASGIDLKVDSSKSSPSNKLAASSIKVKKSSPAIGTPIVAQ